MVKRMNLGVIYFLVSYAAVYAVTRDPWISGLISLVAPLGHVAKLTRKRKLWAPLEKRCQFSSCAVCPGAQHCMLTHRD